MKKIGFLLLAVVSFLFTGCGPEDINELRKDVDEQAARLSVLEARQGQVNPNLIALQNLINAQRGCLFCQ